MILWELENLTDFRDRRNYKIYLIILVSCKLDILVNSIVLNQE